MKTTESKRKSLRRGKREILVRLEEQPKTQDPLRQEVQSLGAWKDEQRTC